MDEKALQRCAVIVYNIWIGRYLRRVETTPGLPASMGKVGLEQKSGTTSLEGGASWMPRLAVMLLPDHLSFLG
jgi:hypothetical protein